MIELKLPQYGMGMTEGTIVEWLKAEGERVEAGEAIASVEAAKATTEIISADAGILKQVLVAEDETVPVGTVLAILEPL